MGDFLPVYPVLVASAWAACTCVAFQTCPCKKRLHVGENDLRYIEAEVMDSV